MKYVIDSSVAFKWEVVEVDSDKARRLRDAFRNGSHELLAPDLFTSEIANSLLVAQRGGRFTKGDYPTHLANILATLPRLHPTLPLLPRVTAITSAFQVSVYDCLYVALAEREQCELVTAVGKLIKIMQGTFPFLVPLASMP
jgi:predicted nucleic acid-binding protein